MQSMGLRKNISFHPAYWIAPVAAMLLSDLVCAEEPEITPNGRQELPAARRFLVRARRRVPSFKQRESTV